MHQSIQPVSYLLGGLEKVLTKELIGWVVKALKILVFILGAAAVLERQKSLRRCKHLLEAWGGQRLETLENCIADLIQEERHQPSEVIDMEDRIDKMFQDLNSDALHFQELYYTERKHLVHLDQQRCAGFDNDNIISA